MTHTPEAPSPDVSPGHRLVLASQSPADRELDDYAVAGYTLLSTISITAEGRATIVDTLHAFKTPAKNIAILASVALLRGWGRK